MKLQTQKTFVISQLKDYGKISRNFCLQNFITRLGAIVEKLNNEGYVIQGAYEKTEKGKDYIYTLISLPPKSKYEILHENYQQTGQLKLQ